MSHASVRFVGIFKFSIASLYFQELLLLFNCKILSHVTQTSHFYTEAVPKKILELMNVPGLTRENVASHLQVWDNCV